MTASAIAGFAGAGGILLAADQLGDAGARPVIFLHGGGQTRASWRRSLPVVAERGYRTIAYDARGHGDSDWSRDGDYRLESYAADLAAVIAQLGRAPILVGASLGGLTAMLLTGEAQHRIADALVLVDVAPRINQQGVDRILDFMAANPDGFRSLDEAADAVSLYNPHRRRPGDNKGLASNLRERGGRLHWHWDPAFLVNRREDRCALSGRLEDAARHVRVPTLLIHAGKSDVVTADEIAHLREVMPHCSYVDVPAAGHMVAGDANDTFNGAILDFLATLTLASPEPAP